MNRDNSARDENDDPDERETLPPPPGSNDAYSAPTRLATMPEAVLASIRGDAPESTGSRRTQSGTRPSVPRVTNIEAPDGAPSSGAMPARPRAEAPMHTPQETWLATPPKTFVPLPLPPSGTVMPQPRWTESNPPPSAPVPEASLTVYQPPFSLPPPPSRARTASLIRSVLVVFVFAVLGGLFAAATTLLGRH